jgi:nicotinamide mononucleotide transporter
MNKYWGSLNWGTILTVITYAIGAALGLVDVHNFNYIEFFAIWTSYVCTLMCVFQTRWNYPLGAVSTILYAILSYQAGLPAVGLFNILLSINLIYGWFRWRSDDVTRPVTNPNAAWWLGYVGIGLATYLILTIVNGYFGYDQTWVDVTTAVVYAVAQAMLDNKHRTSWAVFFVLNVLSIYLYFKQEAYFVVIQYVYFLGNTLYGHFEWRNSEEVFN